MPRNILGVIPARFASSRFPGKVLATIGSKTILQHVYERTSLARYLTSTIIATDDHRVYEAARSFGARVRMTRTDHASGTDRAAEVASTENAEIIANIQGDEPLIDPASIDAAILSMTHEPGIVMSTLKKKIEDAREVTDPNVVKVVTDRRGDAIYFSRCAIPFTRGAAGQPQRDGALPRFASALSATPHFKHVGLYVYRRDFLLAYPALPMGPLEQVERLEQLRAIENGYRIRVVETEYESLGVDTPEDLERVSRLFEATSHKGVTSG